jgi:hypothetical protein
MPLYFRFSLRRRDYFLSVFAMLPRPPPACHADIIARHDDMLSTPVFAMPLFSLIRHYLMPPC